jgi:site-specific DNA-methyltransferase (adenine-specific)
VQLIVARPRTKEFARWGTLPGFYDVARERQLVTGGKPLELMRQIVRDYSRQGDLVADPFAGGGTTLAAAHLEGRAVIGSECNPATYRLALERLKETKNAN